MIGSALLEKLLLNVLLLMLFVFVGSQIQLKQEREISIKSPLKQKAAVGLLMGVFSVIIMFFSMELVFATRVDLRYIAVIIAASIGGVYAALIAAVISALARIALFGISEAAIMGAVTMIVIGAGCGWIASLTKTTWKKWTYMHLYSLSVTSITFYVMLYGKVDLCHLYVYYWTIASIGSIMIAFFTEYLRQTNRLYLQLKEQSTTDFLTGLNNHRQFDAAYNECLQKVMETEEKLSLMMIDIDHFKHINDTYGHDAGDVVLQQLGKVLKQSARSFDIVSRNGGEEFSILLPDCPHHYALDIAERIRKTIANYPFLLPSKEQLHVTVSIGVATYPDNALNAKEILKDADDSLYMAKRTGRNKVCSREIVV